MRVLLVDDRPEELRRYLAPVRELGWEFEAVETVKLAEHLIEEDSFNAVITDMHMEPNCGYELVYYIWAFKLDVPCLVHSKEPSYSIEGKWTELKELEKKFSFVTFHLKPRLSTDNLDYIKDFLNKIKT